MMYFAFFVVSAMAYAVARQLLPRWRIALAITLFIVLSAVAEFLLRYSAGMETRGGRVPDPLVIPRP